MDISKFSEQTKVIFDQCENKIVIGSMKPWCKKDLYEVAMNLKGGQDMKSIKYYNLGKNKNEIIEFKKYFNCNMAPLPVIDNPFSLKERDFAFLLEMLK